jgi:hypothetical protein
VAVRDVDTDGDGCQWRSYGCASPLDWIQQSTKPLSRLAGKYMHWVWAHINPESLSVTCLFLVDELPALTPGFLCSGGQTPLAARESQPA